MAPSDTVSSIGADTFQEREETGFDHLTPYQQQQHIKFQRSLWQPQETPLQKHVQLPPAGQHLFTPPPASPALTIGTLPSQDANLLAGLTDFQNAQAAAMWSNPSVQSRFKQWLQQQQQQHQQQYQNNLHHQAVLAQHVQQTQPDEFAAMMSGALLFPTTPRNQVPKPLSGSHHQDIGSSAPVSRSAQAVVSTSVPAPTIPAVTPQHVPFALPRARRSAVAGPADGGNDSGAETERPTPRRHDKEPPRGRGTKRTNNHGLTPNSDAEAAALDSDGAGEDDEDELDDEDDTSADARKQRALKNYRAARKALQTAAEKVAHHSEMVLQWDAKRAAAVAEVMEAKLKLGEATGPGAGAAGSGGAAADAAATMGGRKGRGSGRGRGKSGDNM